MIINSWVVKKILIHQAHINPYEYWVIDPYDYWVIDECNLIEKVKDSFENFYTILHFFERGNRGNLRLGSQIHEQLRKLYE